MTSIYRDQVEAMSLEDLRSLGVECLDPQSEPIKRALSTQLDDRGYYGIKLACRLAICLELEANTEQIDNPYALPQARLLVRQAYHLIANGNSERLDKHDRLHRYGNDGYIAKFIAILQSPAHHLSASTFGDVNEVELWDDFLWRIGSNANVFPSTQPLNAENCQPVLDFVRQRFDIMLKHPMANDSSS